MDSELINDEELFTYFSSIETTRDIENSPLEVWKRSLNQKEQAILQRMREQIENNEPFEFNDED